MSRHIDKAPIPAHPKPKKLIVLSAPRTGTLGLYEALKIIGFKPYHMVEVFANGSDHARYLYEGTAASARGDYKPYGRAEFDKWFADYDIIIEMPHFMVEQVYEAYPDAKFLLQERNPEKWATSWLNTIGAISLRMQSFPLNLMRKIDAMTDNMGLFADLCRGLYFKSDKNDEVAKKNLVNHYTSYIDKVKRLIPPQQLKVCRLEDGFGWEEICSYLDVPVPDQEWPGRNTPDEFFHHSAAFKKQGQMKLVTIATAVAAPLIAAGIWYLRQSRLR